MQGDMKNRIVFSTQKCLVIVMFALISCENYSNNTLRKACEKMKCDLRSIEIEQEQKSVVLLRQYVNMIIY